MSMRVDESWRDRHITQIEIGGSVKRTANGRDFPIDDGKIPARDRGGFDREKIASGQR